MLSADYNYPSSTTFWSKFWPAIALLQLSLFYWLFYPIGKFPLPLWCNSTITVPIQNNLYIPFYPFAMFRNSIVSLLPRFKVSPGIWKRLISTGFLWCWKYRVSDTMPDYMSIQVCAIKISKKMIWNSYSKNKIKS